MEETQATGEVVVLGGIHPILYKEHPEDPNIAVSRCRIVYNAPQARATQSGLNVHVLYNEIFSAPVTFQGARAARAVGALRGFITSTRDGMEAYLQASLKSKGCPRTFIALPRCFWPKEWGERYKRPMVELDLALVGHPEAGNLWENHAFSKLRPQGWEDATEFPSVFKHKLDDGVLTCYVDDFELQSSEGGTPQHWAKIGSAIDFSEEHEVWGHKIEMESSSPSLKERLRTSAADIELSALFDQTAASSQSKLQR